MTISAGIRHVDPYTLHTHIGWARALAAADPRPNQPAWQRGDLAIPVQLGVGTLFLFADTLCATTTGEPYMARNSAVLVDRRGRVSWLSSGGRSGAALVAAEDIYAAQLPGIHRGTTAWWWPTGGVAFGHDEALVFGDIWRPAPGTPYGELVGPVAHHLTIPRDKATEDPELIPIDTPAWLPRRGPAVVERLAGRRRRVLQPAYDPVTWTHHLLSHDDQTPYATGWQVEPITITDAPLAPLAIRPHRNGWLASAKRAPSGPELDYDETPELALWWADRPAGPYRPLAHAVDDTTRAGHRSYAAHLADLPFVGLVAVWSRNALAGDPATTPNDYGPVFAPARLPTVAETSPIAPAAALVPVESSTVARRRVDAAAEPGTLMGHTAGDGLDAERADAALAIGILRKLMYAGEAEAAAGPFAEVKRMRQWQFALITRPGGIWLTEAQATLLEQLAKADGDG